ncbi:MAG: zinc-dependent metalloprotease [Solirubrobacterales bacterium]
MSDAARDGRALVDWGLAERVALTIARPGVQARPVRARELGPVADRAVAEVLAYTGLDPAGELPAAEAIDRAEWVRANIATFRGMSADLDHRLAESIRTPEPVRGLVRGLVGTVGGAQVGLALGYVGRKVLGQYDVALLGPARPPRLLFVGPNLVQAHGRLGGDRELFLHWIALHETTHAVQFSAVPWLRGHLGGLVEELLDGATLGADLSELRRTLRRVLERPDPRRLADEIREGGLITLLSGPRQVAILRRLQAAMAVVEGYCEHVMDAIGAQLDPGYARLRAAAEIERDRRGLLDTFVAGLLGLDVKLRQYRLGKRFADAVAERSGIAGLNEVWRAPDALPGLEELETPERWLARAHVA